MLVLKNLRNTVKVEMKRTEESFDDSNFSVLPIYHPFQTVRFYISSNGLYTSLIMYCLCSLKVKVIFIKRFTQFMKNSCELYRDGPTCVKYAYFIILFSTRV